MHLTCTGPNQADPPRQHQNGDGERAGECTTRSMNSCAKTVVFFLDFGVLPTLTTPCCFPRRARLSLAHVPFAQVWMMRGPCHRPAQVDDDGKWLDDVERPVYGTDVPRCVLRSRCNANTKGDQIDHTSLNLLHRDELFKLVSWSFRLLLAGSRNGVTLQRSSCTQPNDRWWEISYQCRRSDLDGECSGGNEHTSRKCGLHPGG